MKLLYITVNTKPEDQSTSKTVGRTFINKFLEQNQDCEVIELDLYNEFIPELSHVYYKGRSELVSGADYDALNEADKKAVDRINQLCDQFVSADVYVIAVPMWSVFFPARLKAYIDCVIQKNKVISIEPNEVKGLLDNKNRSMIYIQSSGGKYPKFFNGKFNHGLDYMHDIFKFLGINEFNKILVEGVEDPNVGKEKAIEKANKDIDSIMSAVENNGM
jgi:FMN-dependent NADH-azoreductase